ncbi:MAG: sigma-70 family RNA polymerase sigma factor [bacterium]
MSQANEELALCQRIARGERHLFGEIIDRYSGLVAGCIAGQGVGPADVEDLAQLTFINVFKGIHGFRGEAKLSSWIYRIAQNIARQHLKKQALRPGVDSMEQQLEVGRQPADEREAGSDRMLRQRALDGAMAQLPENQRTALSLYYFEELSYEEISEAMQQNLNTVRTHIRRGKQKLATIIDEGTLGL